MYTECYRDSGHRGKNEDSFCLEHIRLSGKEVILAVVCDGVGGLQQGEVASGFCIEQLLSCFYLELVGRLRHHQSLRRIQRCISRCLYRTHRELVQKGRQKNIQWGTTLALVLCIEKRYLALQVGDSRVLKGGPLLGKWQGILPIDVKKGMLSACLGRGSFPPIHWRIGKLQNRHSLMVASDGFWRGVLLDKRILQPRLLWKCNRLLPRLRTQMEFNKGEGIGDDMTGILLVQRRWKDGV